MNDIAPSTSSTTNHQGYGRYRRYFAVTIALLVTLAVTALFCGATTYSPAEFFTDADMRFVVLKLRAPRVVFCVFIGGALAVIGAAYQALFRNPLASPFSLGVSSGAALGASIGMVTGASHRFWGLDVTISAMFGALLSITLVLWLTRRAVSSQGTSLLLIGIVFSFFCSSILTLVQYISDYAQLFRVTRWMMGGVMVAGPLEVAVAGIISVSVSLWLWLRHRELDLMLFGDELAAVKGVDVRRLYRQSFVVTSLGVGWIVAQCGVIGFVGIVVPATVRLVSGPSHQRLLPLSYCVGALLLVVCDLLGRVLIPPYEIPVGVFTAVLGGPLFVWLLLRSKSIL